MWKNLGKTRKAWLVHRCSEIVAGHISKLNRNDKYLTASFGFAIRLLFSVNFIVMAVWADFICDVVTDSVEHLDYAAT
jgi:hypothetical protein